MEEMDRNPDLILKRIEATQEKINRGKLKIFFGYAAGIGKTYAMLSSAHSMKKAGVDIVAGYIEPHTRPETMRLMKGLEVLPTKIMAQGSMRVQEFDIDAALERKPEVILVDELAHTNAIGSRHEKRYQDIKELLNAGIDVYTTVNVQHIESLNDIIASITGVMVRERVPDSLFDTATQIEMVDIPPEELISRLEQGKIYKKHQARRALDHFFTIENLVALREIALRRMADWVNIEKENTSANKEKEVAVAEHILMCLSSSPSNPKVIRQAARMAKAFHGKFTAFYVETPEFTGLQKEDLERLRENTKLAEQLGAKTIISYGNDIVQQIAEYSKVARVTKIVLGRSYSKRVLFSVKESFSERLAKLSPQLEIFLIPDVYDKRYVKQKKSKVSYFKEKNYIVDMLVSIIILMIATLMASMLAHFKLSESNLIMIYLLGVLVTALMAQHRITSLVYSILSILILNFCFTEPKQTFLVNDPSYIITFGIMFVTAFISSSLTQQVKKVAKLAAKKAHRTEILLETSQKLQQAKDTRAIAETVVEQLGKLLDRSIYCYIGNPEQSSKPLVYKVSGQENDYLPKEELAVAQWTYKNNKHAGFSTTTLPGARCLYLTVRNGEKIFAVVGIDMRERNIPAFEESIMFAILNEGALSFEKDELIRQEQGVAIQLQQEQLRANLLRSISHDLRTPLTSISGDAGVLMSSSDKISENQKHKMYEDMYDDAMWLISLVENLLSVTRIENGTIKLNLQAELLEDVILEALKHVNRKVIEHELLIEQEDDMLVVKIDVKLIMQVLINLINNAIQYTDKGSQIKVRTRKVGRKVWIEVSDNGQGIEDKKKEKIFTMFYTVSDTIVDGRRGMGLGLALCKSIVNAHEGEICVQDNHPTGTTFKFSLNLEEAGVEC